MQARPQRRMPSIWKLATWHGIELLGPACWRCGVIPKGITWRQANRYLDRAHVIDRQADGLDLEPNLRPLCRRCHRSQPTFRPGEETDALAWFGPGPQEQLPLFVLPT